MLQAQQIALLMEQDKHPAAGHYVHLTYWLAHRIGENMDKQPAPFSQHFNISRKKDKMEAVLCNIRDFSNDDDSRQQAADVLNECGCTSPAMPKDQIPLPAPAAVDMDGDEISGAAEYPGEFPGSDEASDE